jgi:hypothetical protein
MRVLLGDIMGCSSWPRVLSLDRGFGLLDLELKMLRVGTSDRRTLVGGGGSFS